MLKESDSTREKYSLNIRSSFSKVSIQFVLDECGRPNAWNWNCRNRPRDSLPVTPKKRKRITSSSSPTSTPNRDASAGNCSSGPPWRLGHGRAPSTILGPFPTFHADLKLLHDPRRRRPKPRPRPEPKPWRVGHSPHRSQVQAKHIRSPIAHSCTAQGHGETSHKPQPWTLGFLPIIAPGIEYPGR